MDTREESHDATNRTIASSPSEAEAAKALDLLAKGPTAIAAAMDNNIQEAQRRLSINSPIPEGTEEKGEQHEQEENKEQKPPQG